MKINYGVTIYLFIDSVIFIEAYHLQLFYHIGVGGYEKWWDYYVIINPY